MKLRVRILRVLCLAIGFAAASIAAAQAPKVKLMGASATVEAYHGFMFLGVALGFYKQLGADVEFATVAGSSAAIQLVGAGTAQMAYSGMDALILAKSKHPTLPVTAVYLHDRGNIYEIAVPDESPIKSVAMLKGQNLGVANLASGAIPAIRAMLGEAGLDPATGVNLIPVGNGAQAAAALRAGRVQALSLFRAQHAVIETLGFKFRYFTRDQPSAVIVVNTDFYRKHPETVAQVLRGIVMGSVFALANPNATVREHWKMFGKPTGISEAEATWRGAHVLTGAARMWKDPRDKSVRWGDMTKAQWDGMQKFLVEQKLLPAAIPSESLFSTDLIGKINNPADAARAEKLAKSM
jgi:NitT/TauT family transport system substrate-binding protein